MDFVKEKLKTESSVQVIFKKTNGDIRVMNCTLNPDYLPEVEEKQDDADKPKKKPNPDVQAVFDHDAEGWRSFRWDSVIAVDGKMVDNFVLVTKDNFESMTESVDWLCALESAGVDNWSGIDYAHELMNEE